jgi:hypothetical protein
MLNLNSDDATFETTNEIWSCPKCFHKNGGINQFCGSCGESRKQNNNRERATGFEPTSAIAVTLIALFLSFILLIAVLLFGAEILAFGARTYSAFSASRADLESTPSSTVKTKTVSPEVRKEIPSPTLTPATEVKVDPTPISTPNLSFPDSTLSDEPPATEPSSATVISENANLRKSPSVTAEIITMVPQGSSVKIIRQRGPWFEVSFGNTKGWLHGNTIAFDLRYDDPIAIP